MQKIFRISISAAIGLIITASLFIGMLSLLKNQRPNTTSAIDPINFSFVKDMSEPQVKPITKRPKPVQEKVKQPPAAPTFNQTNSDPEIALTPNGISAKNVDLSSDFSTPGFGGVGELAVDKQGGIKSAIAPMYPQVALVSKTEGWVKVQINVNEFGTVDSVTILDAKPAKVFNAATKKSVKKWKFHPKTVDGKAQAFVATQLIEFNLDQ